MIVEKILKQLQQYKKINKKYPNYIYISKKNYRRLKKEMSILEYFSEDIKAIYTIDFRIIEEE